MDYPLENLGPERFQQLCQALLVTEFPKVQCFPVAQPDGGRDAVSYYLPEQGKFIVFQVKFVRRPQAEREPHKWLIEHLRAELPKILNQRKKGATQYFLITNVPGTAHEDVGSIDKASALLTQETGIESFCWWRDDVNRRLDVNWDLKWSYPEIMAGPDFLRSIIEQGVSEDKERRAASLKAFLRTQYVADEQVRFKQVELQNNLFDLFIDVPIIFDDKSADPQQFNAYHRAIVNYLGSRGEDAGSFMVERTLISSIGRLPHPGMQRNLSHEIGAAAFLLSSSASELLPTLVIEGAPGQGKSTITQYLCQVHRTRLLNTPLDVDAVKHLPKGSAIRLPIKVDLRDYATWLSRRNPFSVENSDPPVGWHKSLESFLAALISEFSGGTTFGTSDLLAVLKPTSVLLVLDGLDEVADISRRKEIVEEIVKGVQRLQENAASIQVIVTSRPAAFANSPGMPHSKYTYLQLGSLSKPSILEYAGRWMKAKLLEPKHRVEFNKILSEKLDQPHLRDLARNPMQLAILLTLILTRGASLPDKRTALYDFYIDLFFSREAEKSEIVRNHRQLLIDIHGYLGWLLQAESELGDARPSISQDRLLSVVSEYLDREGHDVSLSALLFTGMVERVVALVSRIQGTFEFEVQPLREYFAAYFLYDTAPQSSAGKERPGSRPDRFDALARNFYWLNVTRFFAGRYSKGELPSLVERLEELAASEGFSRIGHPGSLAATLLGDWVFTQSPRSVTEAVKIILDRGKIRLLTAETNVRYRGRAVASTFLLPQRCGRDELIAAAFSLLQRSVSQDVEGEMLQLIRVNAEKRHDLLPVWKPYFLGAVSVDDKLTWLRRCFDLEIFDEASTTGLLDVIGDLRYDSKVEALLYQFGFGNVLCEDEKSFDHVIDLILARETSAARRKEGKSILDRLAFAMEANRFSLAFSKREPIPLVTLLAQHELVARRVSHRTVLGNRTFRQFGACGELASVCEGQLKLTGAEWATSLAPWEAVCEAGRRLFGERWAFAEFANMASGIKSSKEMSSKCMDLLNHANSLCGRVRYARLRSGNPRWWRKQFDRITNDYERALILLVLFSWAKNGTLLNLLVEIEASVSLLSPETWQRVFFRSRYRPYVSIMGTESFGEAVVVPETMSPRLASVFAARLSGKRAYQIYETHFSSELGMDKVGLEFVMAHALNIKDIESDKWHPDLPLIRRVYKAGWSSEPAAFYEVWRNFNSLTMSVSIAKEITESPLDYPGFLLAVAEEACRSRVTEHVVAVSVVATREGWF